MPIFAPPATERCPPDYIPPGPAGQDRFYPSPLPIRKLMGRYRGELRAPNVFKLTQAAADSFNDGVLYTTQQPYEDTPGSVIAYTYLGGHSYEVTASEALLLANAGYGDAVTGVFPATDLFPSTTLYPESA